LALLLLDLVTPLPTLNALAPALGPPPLPIEMLFQLFMLNFSRDMSKINDFNNKLSNIAKGSALHLQRLTFDIGDLKFRYLAKLCFFKLIMTKSNFKKISYNVISVTSLLLRHRKASPK